MHFTYAKDLDEQMLFQGDVLSRTDALEELFHSYHRYYLKEDYRYFQVLTQSCDLFKRNDACRARYVTLGAVRPLETALRREIDGVRKEERDLQRTARIANKDQRRKIEEFLESLLNNNLKPYFYLHEDLEAGFTDCCCTFLRLSVAVQAKHYNKLLSAKILQLTPQFQAKLGWLTGDMYSRVATEDWVPTEDPTRSQFNRRIKRIIQQEGTTWVEDESHGRLIKRLRRDEEDVDPTRAQDVLKNLRIEQKENPIDRLRSGLLKADFTPDQIDHVVRIIVSESIL